LELWPKPSRGKFDETKLNFIKYIISTGIMEVFTLPMEPETNKVVIVTDAVIAED